MLRKPLTRRFIPIAVKNEFLRISLESFAIAPANGMRSPATRHCNRRVIYALRSSVARPSNTPLSQITSPISTEWSMPEKGWRTE
jgi:hypothetical protein